MSAIKKEVIIGNCRLLLGDCLQILPILPKHHALVTDPPYGMDLNTDYSGFNGWSGKGTKYSPVEGDQEPFNPAPFLEICPKAIIWGAQYFCRSLPESGGWLVFNKRGNGAPSEICFGDCELAWSNTKQSVRMYSEVWHGVSRWMKEGRHHPTQKSVGLMIWCLEQLARPPSVLDPFMGSGTTGVACARTGVKFTGIEIDPVHFDIACKRIEEAYRQPDLFVEELKPPEQVGMEF